MTFIIHFIYIHSLWDEYFNVRFTHTRTENSMNMNNYYTGTCIRVIFRYNYNTLLYLYRGHSH